MPKVIELRPGEPPSETPYLLIDCFVGTVATHAVRDSKGLTERINPNDLEMLLPMFVHQAKSHRFKAVYVRGAPVVRRA